jgi:hypothetical protein
MIWMGEKWNRRPDNAKEGCEGMGLIARFRLIKNIPANFLFFGKSPMSSYDQRSSGKKR